MILLPLIASNLWRKCQPLCAVLAPMAGTVGLSVGAGSVPVAAHPHQIKSMSGEGTESVSPWAVPLLCSSITCSKTFWEKSPTENLSEKLWRFAIEVLLQSLNWLNGFKDFLILLGYATQTAFGKTRLRMIICQYNNSEMGYKWKIFHLVAYFLFPETFGRLSSTAASLCTSVGAEVGSRVMGRWEVGTLRGRILSKINLETPKMSQKYLKQKKLVSLHNFCWSPGILLCIGQFLRSTVRGESLMMWENWN